MSITDHDALTRAIDHREIFHDEMLSVVRRIITGDMSPLMMRRTTDNISSWKISR